MRIAAVIVSFVLISANVVCASDRFPDPSVAAEGAAWVARLRPPAQDDRPIAGVISGEFYIYGTAKKLNCQAGLLWMTQLAEAGNAEAMFELGDLYETAVVCKRASREHSHGFSKLRKTAARPPRASSGSYII